MPYSCYDGCFWLKLVAMVSFRLCFALSMECLFLSFYNVLRSEVWNICFCDVWKYGLLKCCHLSRFKIKRYINVLYFVFLGVEVIFVIVKCCFALW